MARIITKLKIIGNKVDLYKEEEWKELFIAEYDIRGPKFHAWGQKTTNDYEQ